MRRQRVRAAGAVDEHRGLQAAAARGRLKRIACLVRKRARIDLVPLGGAHPAAGGKHHRRRLVRDERGLIDGLRRFALDDLRAAVVAELLRIGFDLRRRPACAVSPCSSAAPRAPPAPPASSFCSSRIFISSSLARWRSLVSRIASTCSSESLKRFISTGFGSSSRRMILITSSRLRKTTSRPCEDVQAPRRPCRGGAAGGA